MPAEPPPRGPSGVDLLLGTPAAVAYIQRHAATAFPEGPPSADEAAAVADAVWRRLRDHPEADPPGWDPGEARALRIGAAFDRGGLLAAFAEARRGPPGGSGWGATADREEEE